MEHTENMTPRNASMPVEMMEFIICALVQGDDCNNEIPFADQTDDTLWSQSYAYSCSTLQPTLASICLLNTTWYTIAIGRLYSNIHLATSSALSKFRRTLTRSRKKHLLRGYVHTILFSRFLESEHKNEVPRLLPRKVRRDITAVCSLCPDLVTSTIMRSDISYKRTLVDVVRRRHPSPPTHPLYSGQIPCASLTHLTVQSPPFRQTRLSFVGLSLPRLQELVLSDFTALGTMSNRLELPCSMPALLALRFVDCCFWGQHMPFPGHAPRLRLLEVVNGVIATQRFWVAIASVAKTIESLTLVPRFLAKSNSGFDFSTLVNVVEFRLRFVRSIIIA